MVNMRHTDVMKKAMIDTGIRQIDIQEQLGMKSQSTISERINQKNIGIRTFLEILDVLGYELVARPKTTENPPEGEYILRRSDYDA